MAMARLEQGRAGCRERCYLGFFFSFFSLSFPFFGRGGATIDTNPYAIHAPSL